MTTRTPAENNAEKRIGLDAERAATVLSDEELSGIAGAGDLTPSSGSSSSIDAGAVFKLQDGNVDAGAVFKLQDVNVDAGGARMETIDGAAMSGRIKR